MDEPAGGSKEDARQPTAPLKEVTKHVRAPSGESAITFTSSQLLSEDGDPSPSSESMRFFFILHLVCGLLFDLEMFSLWFCFSRPFYIYTQTHKSEGSKY